MSTTSCKMGSHFVLVHGAAHGAWCWYRIRCLLECTGHKVTCPDLRGCGIDSTDPTTISTFDEYNQPLDDILSGLPEGEKVILVGHSAGGLNVTGAIHKYPHKLHAVVFAGAAMYKNGFEEKQHVNDEGHMHISRKAEATKVRIGNNAKDDAKLIHESILQLFWNLFCHPLNCLLLMIPDHSKHEDDFDANEVLCNDSLVAGIVQEKTLYQLSPLEDRTLAAMLIRTPASKALRSAKFADGKDSDKVPRVYIKTLHDRFYSQEEQDRMIEKWPPSDVYEIDSDHFPLFSNPFEFLGLLLKIADKFGCH